MRIFVAIKQLRNQAVPNPRQKNMVSLRNVSPFAVTPSDLSFQIRIPSLRWKQHLHPQTTQAPPRCASQTDGCLD